MPEEKKILLIEPHYLPCIAYFVELLQYEKVCLDIHSYYEKQNYRNRCYIKLSNKVEALSIPIKKEKTKELLKDVRLDYTERWAAIHWRSITSAYGKSPFWEHYEPFFASIFERQFERLLDFQLELLTVCLKLMNTAPKISFTEAFVEKNNEKEAFIDLRNHISPKNEYHPERQNGKLTYYQVFGETFVGNLSVLDLLCCEGPNAINLIKKEVLSIR